MTFLLIDHLVRVYEPSGPEETGELFDEIVREILPTGHSGQALWIRPRGEGEDVSARTFSNRYDGNGEGLRVEIDVDAGRAALTWLPDDSIAVELPPGDPLRIMWSIDAPVITVPGGRARTSAATARRAVLEYLASGRRPRTGIVWTPPPEAAPATVDGASRHRDGGAPCDPVPDSDLPKRLEY
ncbi:hypothetical protein [Actinomadura sp. WMMA1423]|uniref:hypothetical protein n=1 Tax=Actinomadura sp. WMMA1423 TaxID=2591108 RepID=UPI0011468B6C|nr:hypothetical protein [Actinomadura sp. WMMA1423]